MFAGESHSVHHQEGFIVRVERRGHMGHPEIGGDLDLVGQQTSGGALVGGERAPV